ncbi:MAG: FAD-binding oxidoreductase [Candidatus Kapaibacteriales bacterium]
MAKPIPSKYESFGRYPKSEPGSVSNIVWKSDLSKIDFTDENLPIGKLRTYGDSCQLHGGHLIDLTHLNRLISWDQKNGIIEAEAGISFEDLLTFLVPKGYFVPVTPGTKYVTLGGAIANDVHGKNHHVAGTFGNHVISFVLYRTDRGFITCSEDDNTDLFKATIGGLGLTGIIVSAKFKCEAIETPFIYQETIKYKSLSDFFDLNTYSEQIFPCTVAWVDCTTQGRNMGRGIYIRGRFASKEEAPSKKVSEVSKKGFPFDYPFINGLSVSAFNKLFYAKQLRKQNDGYVHYEPFFYPLDGILNWNKAYGKNGFMQYQFVIPHGRERKGFEEFFQVITKSGLSSFLTVMKTFGDIKSPGMLSFPIKGVNLAIDIRNDGKKTLDFLAKLDELVIKYDGRIYPAKDSRMPGEHFRKYYPNWEEFSQYIDKPLISDFWKRVTK